MRHSKFSNPLFVLLFALLLALISQNNASGQDEPDTPTNSAPNSSLVLNHHIYLPLLTSRATTLESRDGLAVLTDVAASAAQPPRIDQMSTGCRDGLCFYVIGTHILDANPSPIDNQNRYQHTYVNVYHGKEPDRRIKRYYRYQFVQDNLGQNSFAIDINDPQVEKIFQQHGLYVQVVNPDHWDRVKWTGKNQLAWKRNNIVLFENFQGVPSGPYSERDILSGFNLVPAIGWIRRTVAHLQSRVYTASFLHEQSKVLSVSSPAGEFGPLGGTAEEPTGGGLSFSTRFCAGNDACAVGRGGTTASKGFEELYLSYWVRFQGQDDGDSDFSGEFDFKMGGKLPGLAGGHLGVSTGGGQSINNNDNGPWVYPNGENGWSARAHFQSGGQVSQYLYYPGNDQPVDSKGRQFGDPVSWEIKKGEPFKFESHRWYRILQRVKMNSMSATGAGNADGVIQVWVDNDLVLERRDILFRNAKSGANDPTVPPYEVEKVLDIDALMFHFFHGGGDCTYAPDTESIAQFDDVIVFEPHR